jgi:hypothetical protein
MVFLVAIAALSLEIRRAHWKFGVAMAAMTPIIPNTIPASATRFNDISISFPL